MERFQYLQCSDRVVGDLNLISAVANEVRQEIGGVDIVVDEQDAPTFRAFPYLTRQLGAVVVGAVVSPGAPRPAASP